MKKVIFILVAMIVCLISFNYFSKPMKVSRPNLDLAKPLKLGTEVSGKTEDGHGLDIYEVSLPKSGNLNVSFDYYNNSAYIKIYDTKGVELQNDYVVYQNALGVANANLDYPLTKGSYYIVLHGNAYEGQKYKLTTSYKGSGESILEEKGGVNNHIDEASSIRINKDYYGQIAYNDQRDVYAFTLTKPVDVTVDVEAKLSGATYAIYDEKGKCLFQQKGGWSKNIVDPQTNRYQLKEKVSLKEGNYYFSVTGFEQKKRQFYGNYRFKLSAFTIDYKISYHMEGADAYGSEELQYGKTYTLKENKFEKLGYHFSGWTLQRMSDQKWLYTNDDVEKWCEEGKQPVDFIKKVFKNQEQVKNLSPKNGEELRFNARMIKNSFTIKYHGRGGEGSMKNTIVKYGNATALRTNTFQRAGYDFAGWTCYRSSDKKWYYSDGKQYGWYKENYQPKGYVKVIYLNKATVAKTTAVHKDNVHMFARWEKHK